MSKRRHSRRREDGQGAVGGAQWSDRGTTHTQNAEKRYESKYMGARNAKNREQQDTHTDVGRKHVRGRKGRRDTQEKDYVIRLRSEEIKRPWQTESLYRHTARAAVLDYTDGRNNRAKVDVCKILDTTFVIGGVELIERRGAVLRFVVVHRSVKEEWWSHAACHRVLRMIKKRTGGCLAHKVSKISRYRIKLSVNIRDTSSYLTWSSAGAEVNRRVKVEGGDRTRRSEVTCEHKRVRIVHNQRLEVRGGWIKSLLTPSVIDADSHHF
ncbi:hypothetical protein Tco_1034700 [Tanacetum coccineum]